ncbi:hypothetical protein MEO41_22670, partial [Dolichospermum sp. ST_sed4]|nr:hypothetical protein [Dolichospermum sp. ST_sed4]
RAVVFTTIRLRIPVSLDRGVSTADEQWRGNPYLEFESQVQRWLEKLKLQTNIDSLPDDLKNLFSGRIINILRLGEVRAGGPRWSKVAKC